MLLTFQEIGIIRQLTFSSTLQRMSVVVRELNAPTMRLYMKGSPEKVCNTSRVNTNVWHI